MNPMSAALPPRLKSRGVVGRVEDAGLPFMTDTEPSQRKCPHCGAHLSRFEIPDAAGFDEPYHLACFNDECPYYLRGWAWMLEQYGVRSSYRYRVDPKSGHESPLAVWSSTALKGNVVPDGGVDGK